MPGKRKITIDTLTELGPHKLAELLLAEAAGNRKLKQAIDLAISAKEGPVALGAAVRKRLAGYVKSRSMQSYERGREIIVEFDELRTVIVENIGVENPRLALDLLWELIELHPSILELVDDSSGYAGDVFTAACYDLGPLAERASIDPYELAELVLQKITNNHYGIYDGLITSLNAALGRQGRAKLRGLLLQRRQQYQGRNLHLDYRFGGGDSGAMPKLLKELMQLHPDVILAATTPAATAARQQTLSLPIVFVQVPDAVSAGYVTNLAHPEGNITGFTNFEFSIGARWLQLMKDCAPAVNRIAVVFDPANPSWAAYLRTIETAAPSFKVQLTPLGVRDAAEIDSNIQAFASEPNGGLIVLPSPVTQTHRGRIIAVAEQRRLPAIYPYRHFAAEGGLLSYGIDLADLYKQAASYVDRILKGAKPADLPVQLPTKFELVINLKTAKASGFDLPASLVARANEVIE